MKSFMDGMRDWRKELAIESTAEERAYYKRVDDFVRSGTYSTYRQAQYLASLCLAGKSTREISEKLKVQEPSIRYYKSSLLSQPLYKLFGEDFFELVKLYNDDETKKTLLKRLYLAETTNAHRDTYCGYDILDKVDGVTINFDDYNLRDCKTEIQFLRAYNKKKVQRALEGVDPYRLEYLLSIIDGECGTRDERYNLIYLLEN